MGIEPESLRRLKDAQGKGPEGCSAGKSEVRVCVVLGWSQRREKAAHVPLDELI